MRPQTSAEQVERQHPKEPDEVHPGVPGQRPVLPRNQLRGDSSQFGKQAGDMGDNRAEADHSQEGPSDGACRLGKPGAGVQGGERRRQPEQEDYPRIKAAEYDEGGYCDKQCNRPMIRQMADETRKHVATLDWHDVPYASFAGWVMAPGRDGWRRPSRPLQQPPHRPPLRDPHRPAEAVGHLRLRRQAEAVVQRGGEVGRRHRVVSRERRPACRRRRKSGRRGRRRRPASRRRRCRSGRGRRRR